jgi:hypothetical protein
MANLEGMKMKYVVLKVDDINRYLDEKAKIEISAADATIGTLRMYEGKNLNSYLVINTDEPYVNEVIEIMKRHGHWG